MAKSLLAAVHDALMGPADDVLDEDETGAPALDATQEDVQMSKDNQPAGGDSKTAGISQAEHDAAVNAATESGKAEGVKAATERLQAALGAEGIKGDAGRMAAALDLAVKSPGMSGADVAAFVVANVAASAAPSSAETYAAGRVAAAGASQPSAPAKKATIDRGGIYAARRKQSQES